VRARTTLLVVVWASVIAPGPAWGQGLGFGLTGGVLRSEINSSDVEAQNVALQHRSSPTGGLFVTLPVSESFWVQPEVLLSVKGTQWEASATSQVAGSLRLTYLDVPVLFRYAGLLGAPVRIHVFGGPSAGFLLRASSEVARPFQGTSDVQDRFGGLDLGWVFGVGLGGRRWHVDLRYGGSFMGITDEPELPGGAPTPDTGAETTFRNRAFQLLAGVRLF
jgi:hypothetical protein